MIFLASFFSQPVVFGTSISEVLQDATLLALVFGAYKHIECQQQGCRRLGVHPHGHLHLCGVHHPKVDGKVTLASIDTISKELE